MPNIVLSNRLLPQDFANDLKNNLPHELAKEIVLTIVEDPLIDEVFIRYSKDQDLRDIKAIRNLILNLGLKTLLFKASLYQHILVTYYGFGPELYDLIHGNTMTPDVALAFHNSEFHSYPSRVETLSGISAPFAAVQSTSADFGTEYDCHKATTIAKYLSSYVCDVELFLRHDNGRMSEFIAKRK